jgi:HK97 family phage major capsid protein
MAEHDIDLRAVNEAVTELREEVKKATPDKEKLEKINGFLDSYEEKNQELVTSMAAEKKAREEQAERLEAMEAELSRKGASHHEDYREAPEYKALEKFVMTGSFDTPEEKALLRTDSDTSGGYLVTSEMDNTIVKGITEISPMRSVARVRTVGKKTLEMAIRSGIPTALYEGETEEGGSSASTYKAESLTAYRQTTTIPVTMDMLMDSSFNMDSEIMSDAMEAFAQGEGSGFIIGTGVKQPEGITANTELQTGAVTSSTSGAIDAEDFISITGELKTGYDPVYLLNRKTLANLRTKTDTNGGFLWQPGLNGPVAATINGFRYVLTPDMPDIAAGAYSVAFGDFLRGYTIIDRTGISMVRDEYSRKKEAIVEFTINRWNTGLVTLPEAIKLLKVKA